jgi:hypothetical protein
MHTLNTRDIPLLLLLYTIRRRFHFLQKRLPSNDGRSILYHNNNNIIWPIIVISERPIAVLPSRIRTAAITGITVGAQRGLFVGCGKC